MPVSEPRSVRQHSIGRKSDEPKTINYAEPDEFKSPGIESCEAVSEEGENPPNASERTGRKRVIKSIDLTHKSNSF